jgi:hypothetical protein
MTPLRSLLAGAAAMAMIPGMVSAQTCLQPAEKTHFDVRALQSQLMVVAISCEMQDDYNRFVTKFQPQLATAYRGVAGHFRRTAGGSHQRQLDQYITNLANGQSQVGISQGSFFCRNQGPLFQQALAASNVGELAQLSVQREVPQTYAAGVCSGAPARGASNREARPRTQQQQRPQQQPNRTAAARTQPASATR